MGPERVREEMTVPEDRRESVLGKGTQCPGRPREVMERKSEFPSVPVTGCGDNDLEGGSLQGKLMPSSLISWRMGVAVVTDSVSSSLEHLSFLSNRTRAPRGSRAQPLALLLIGCMMHVPQDSHAYHGAHT